MKIFISEIEEIFKDIFKHEEGLVKSVETVFEKSDNSDFYKLVISIHEMSIEDTIIIHTKFVFKTDTNKEYLIDNSFSYLYDINCIYHTIKFDSISKLRSKIESIVRNNKFGEDIILLSDFIVSPVTFLNFYLTREKITDYSVYDVAYDPKFKMTPCYETTFDFKINVNNNYNIDLSISKNNSNSKEAEYKFAFKFMDDYDNIVTDTLKNIHYTIGGGLSEILNRNLKNIKESDANKKV